MCDYEYPEFFNQIMVQARKKHACCECDRCIYAGEQYEKTVGKWDGRIAEFKTCHDCVIVREEYGRYLTKYDDECRPPFGSLWSHLRGSSIDRPERADEVRVRTIRKMWADYLWNHRHNNQVCRHLRTQAYHTRKHRKASDERRRKWLAEQAAKSIEVTVGGA